MTIERRGQCSGCDLYWGMTGSFPNFLLSAGHGERSVWLECSKYLRSISRHQMLANFRPKLDLDGLECSDGERLLEVNVGTGEGLVQLGQRFPGCHLSGVDISKQFLGLAWDNCRAASVEPWLALAEARNLPFEDGLFANVLLFEVVAFLLEGDF